MSKYDKEAQKEWLSESPEYKTNKELFIEAVKITLAGAVFGLCVYAAGYWGLR